MSSKNQKRVGEISVREGREIEWTIRDIFSYKAEDVCYDSPSFEVSGSRWCLSIYPNGGTRNNSLGWIGLYLLGESNSPPRQGANYDFGLKRADGTVDISKKDLTWVFDERGKGLGWSKVRQRSELLRLRSELAPSGALTVTCSLRVYRGADLPASLNTLSENFLVMFNSKRGCDATLKVKHEEYPVHTCILAARSPVFAAMFESDMKGRQTGVADIVNCDPVAFKDFLTYLYSGRAENLPNNAFELFRIADKYGVGDLKPTCLVSIMRDLSLENALDAAILADEFSEDCLKLKTQAFFNENLGDIFSTARWESFLKSNSRLANELLKNMASEMELKKRSPLSRVKN